MISEDAAMNIRIRAFENCSWIFQSTYPLAPAGREDPQYRHLHSPILPTLAKPRDDPDRDRSAHVGFAPPPNNLDSDGEDNLLKLPEDVEDFFEEPVDASVMSLLRGNSNWIFGVKLRTD
jgi:hypothetical protein